MKVLIADDSAFMRRALSEMLSSQRGVEIHVAKDGAEALAMARSIRPDVITLDVNMPVMDGLTCLAHIMTECPCPVIMVSSLTQDGAMATLEALNMGAVDYIPKPGGTVSLNVEQVRAQLLEKIKVAARAQVRGARRAPGAPAATPARAAPRPAPRRGGEGLVLLGCSTGGPQALEEVLPMLPGDFPWPVVVAQHIPGAFTASLAKRLDALCSLRVEEVARMTAIEPGHVYVARGDSDLLISRRSAATFALPVPADDRFLWHPSVDRLVQSALEQLPASQLIGVLLTGMGYDGAEAMTELRRRGGHTVAESEDSAVVFGMPSVLVEKGGAERVLPLRQIPAQLQRWV